MFTWQETLKIFILTAIIAFLAGYTFRWVQDVKEEVICEAKQMHF